MDECFEKRHDVSKYAPGLLHVVFFDRLGAKRESWTSSGSYVQACAAAEQYIAESEERQGWSYCVLRVLKNSLQPANWANLD